MASDLISRKALIEAYDKAHKGPPGGARKLMEEAPGVDAVEVVRCKDCVYSTKQDEDLYCDGPIGIFGTVGFNDFCSCGERKKDGDL